MIARDRVLDALRHKETDRVPINFRATDYIIEKLCQELKTDYNGLLEFVQCDFREIFPKYVGPELEKLENGDQLDIWHVGRTEVITKNSRDVYVNFSPLSNAESVEDLENFQWPKATYYDFSSIEQQCDDFKNYAVATPGIHAEGYHGVFHILTYLFGMEKAMYELALNEEMMFLAIERISEYFLDYYTQMLEAGNGKIDFVFYKDDFGSQNSLLISKDMFRKFFAPSLKKFIELAESYGATLILHSCGSVVDLIPEFIDLGLKVLDPIQTSAKGMDIKVIKEKFGEKLTFHGAIDTQTVLPNSTEEQIVEIVKNTIDVMGEGGGYFFSPSHRIQQDTPIENVLAMYRTAKEYPRK